MECFGAEELSCLFPVLEGVVYREVAGAGAVLGEFHGQVALGSGQRVSVLHGHVGGDCIARLAQIHAPVMPPPYLTTLEVSCQNLVPGMNAPGAFSL